MLLTIKNLQVNYGKQTALSIRRPIVIERGERIGIIGSNGAGKTTLVKAVLGLVDYRGAILTDLRKEEIAAHLQFNEYVNTMRVGAIMEAVLDVSVKRDKRLQELIEYFEFGPCLQKRYSSLSGGQKQRFTIILVMMQDAPLTFYDEVTSGLDFETRQRLMERLVKWYEKKESTLCIVSHYYEELELLADKLLLLDKGKVIDYGEKEELFRKYCGNAIFLVDHTPKNAALLKEYPKLLSPEHLIAIPCRTREEETEIAGFLVAHNMNFKRSNHDIEIMSVNAKAAYYEGGEADEKENAE